MEQEQGKTKSGCATYCIPDEHLDGTTDDMEMEPPCGRCSCVPEWFRLEAVCVIKLSWPMILTSLFNFLMAPISLIFCGRLGHEELGGVALAHTVINAFGIIVGTGLCAALDTLISQSYGGNNMKMIGIYLQRGIIVTTLFLVPIYVFHMNITPFLILIGQQPHVAVIAGDFVLYFMPGLFFNFMYQVLTKYLYNQNVVFPCILFGIMGCAVNVLSHVGLVMYGGLGTTGSSLSMVITFFSMMLFCIIYITSTGFYKRTWSGWSMDSLQDWGSFCALAVPGLFMLVLEWGAFEIGTFLTGLIGVVPLDAQTIVFHLEGISYMIPLGLSIAANIRTGQFLGREDAISAKRTGIVCIILACCCAAVMSLILGTLRYYLPQIFTNHMDVVEYSADLLIILATYMVFNCIQGVCAGILRGCGRQLIGAIAVFIAYYVLALPIGVPVMFKTHLEARGYWWGLTIGLFVEAMSFLIIFAKTDWNYQVEQARKRAGFTDDMAGPVEEDIILSSEKIPAKIMLSREHIPMLSKEHIALDYKSSFRSLQCHNSPPKETNNQSNLGKYRAGNFDASNSSLPHDRGNLRPEGKRTFSQTDSVFSSRDRSVSRLETSGSPRTLFGVDKNYTSSYSIAGSHMSDSSRAGKPRRIEVLKLYNGPHVGSQQNIHVQERNENPVRLSFRQILLRRGLTIGLLLVFLAVGVFLRLRFAVEYPLKLNCIPMPQNSSHLPGNVTGSYYCNSADIINVTTISNTTFG
ncbi:multidrug and toxin extrusion protein 1-like isoform X2 [Tubulanus polymorphus]